MKDKHQPDVEDKMCELRDLIYTITQDKAKSPMSEGEIEEIARCALRGGYKLDIEAFAASFGRFMLNLDN